MAGPSVSALPLSMSLNGDDWVFKGYYGEDWLWRNGHLPATRDVRHWQPASVPGSVLDDLWRTGQIADPYVGLNSLNCEWAAARTWLYKKTFTVPAERQGQPARLRFDGVDYAARFYLNGALLGEHTGMYTPAIFEVGDRLAYGAANTLVVVIAPAPEEQPQVGYSSRVRTHKARMNYWWDFCPRLVHQGVWQPVTLLFTGPVRVEEVWARPTVAAPWREAQVRVTTALSSSEAVEVRVTTTIRQGERTVGTHSAQHVLAPGSTSVVANFQVAEAQLWWPNGQGGQPLYTAVVTVETLPVSAVPALSDARSVRFGLRHIEFVPNDGAPVGARPYVLVVNGRRLYINGWNWVPMDALYGVPRPQKLERLLTLAQRAHVNLLRVWGGGLIETPAFYDRCDELGLLVWQEFIQSSSGIDNDPPRDPAFIAALSAEARQIIPSRRNHPALAVWCGGNELQVAPETPADDSHPMLAALKGVVNELDPDRAWLPTSPTGPVFSNSLEHIAADPDSLHDVHGPWEHQGQVAHFTLYNQGTALLHSEFGVEGLTNRRVLDRLMPPEAQWPVTLDNPLWQHLGAWWVKAARWREIFGEVADLATLHRAVQWLSADGLRYALEANRRRQFRCAGSLPWQFNEPYPMAACTSAVDYYAQPKPAYYAVARAYAPVHISARFDRQAWAGAATFQAEVWASNARVEPLIGAQVVARVIGPDGRVYHAAARSVDMPANGSVSLLSSACALEALADEVFFLDLALSDVTGRELSRNLYVFSQTADLAPLLGLPATSLAAQLEPAGDAGSVTLTNTGQNLALYVWLEPDRPCEAGGYAYFSDNYVCVLPGETRRIMVKWVEVPTAERRLTVNAWNVAEQAL